MLNILLVLSYESWTEILIWQDCRAGGDSLKVWIRNKYNDLLIKILELISNLRRLINFINSIDHAKVEKGL